MAEIWSWKVIKHGIFSRLVMESMAVGHWLARVFPTIDQRLLVNLILSDITLSTLPAI